MIPKAQTRASSGGLMGIESALSPDVDLCQRVGVPKLCGALCLLSVRHSLYNCSGKRVERCVHRVALFVIYCKQL